MKVFKAYDIRGKWNTDFNIEDVYRIGFFLPKILNANTILIGRDARLSSDEIFEALAKGITDYGVNVVDAGLTTTPMIYWSTARFGYPASVMITASHNPKDHNGLKVSGANALPIGYDNGLNTLEKLVESTAEIVPKTTRGTISQIDLSTDYIAFMKAYLKDISNLKIGIDSSNGMASLFIEKILGDAPIYINNTADGSFPNHEPNPLEPENQEQIKKLVRGKMCDAGVIFDGDADRVMFIDEKGNFIAPDLIIAFLGHYFFEQKHDKGIVLRDIRSSRAIPEYLEQFDVKVETWRVGRAYGANKLRELDGVYGGEVAGHYYFREFYYSDSGILAAIIVLNLLSDFKAKGITFSEIIKKISPYHNSGEINFKLERKQEAMDAVRDYFRNAKKPITYYDFDGYRLDYDDWWFSIRQSNTEPYLRFIAEAKDEKNLQQIITQVTEIIHQFSK